jgi:photosystem II stability/assembly factor-like uncharacterized protein
MSGARITISGFFTAWILIMGPAARAAQPDLNGIAAALGIHADVFEDDVHQASTVSGSSTSTTHWDRLPLFTADVNQIAEMSDGTLLAATYTGVFRSLDGGGHWEAVVNGLPTATAISIVCDDADRLFVSIFTRGIYRSLDGGTTWSSTGVGSGRIVMSLAVAAPQSIFAGTSDGAVLRSTDSGLSWQEFLMPFQTAIMVVTVLSPDIVLAGTLGRGVLRSSDAGATWTTTTLTSAFVRTVQPCADGRVLAGSEAGPDIGGALHVSTDLGSSWSALSNPFTGAIGGMTESGSTLVAAAVRTGVSISSDKGQTWTAAMTGLSISFGSHGVTSDAGGDLYLATRGDGVFRSTNGGQSWAPANEGLTGYKVEDLAWTPSGVAVVALSASGLFRSADGGATWHAANAGIATGSAFSLACDETDGSLYAGMLNGLVYRTTDDGVSWTNVTGNLPGTDAVNAIRIDETTGDVWVGKSSRGVWKRAPGSATWESVVCDLSDLSVTSLVESSASDLVAGTTFTGVYRLQDTGCWSEYSAEMPAGPGAIESMVRGTLSRSLFATTSLGVYRMSAGGSLWSLTSLLIPYIRSLCAAPDGAVYAGAGYFNVLRSNDVLQSTDDGQSWTSLRGDMPTNDPINHIAAHGPDLFAGTWNGGLFVSRSVVSAAREETDPPAGWLRANYPNPFWSATRFSFRVTGTNPVTARIYSPAGRLVRTILNGTSAAGEFTAVWDGADDHGRQVPAGVYILTVESGGHRESRKMTLSR